MWLESNFLLTQVEGVAVQDKVYKKTCFETVTGSDCVALCEVIVGSN
jgi:hypothetical protein